MESNVEQLLEQAKEKHQAGDFNGALAHTYEAVGLLYREIKEMKQSVEEKKQ